MRAAAGRGQSPRSGTASGRAPRGPTGVRAGGWGEWMGEGCDSRTRLCRRQLAARLHACMHACKYTRTRACTRTQVCMHIHSTADALLPGPPAHPLHGVCHAQHVGKQLAGHQVLVERRHAVLHRHLKQLSGVQGDRCTRGARAGISRACGRRQGTRRACVAAAAFTTAVVARRQAHALRAHGSRPAAP